MKASTLQRRHKEAHFKHAARRAMERYGFVLTEDLKNRILKQMRSNGARLVEKQSCTRKIYDMRFWSREGDDPILHTTPFRFVYCKTTKEIVTFLPMGERKDA